MYHQTIIYSSQFSQPKLFPKVEDQSFREIDGARGGRNRARNLDDARGVPGGLPVPHHHDLGELPSLALPLPLRHGRGRHPYRCPRVVPVVPADLPGDGGGGAGGSEDAEAPGGGGSSEVRTAAMAARGGGGRHVGMPRRSGGGGGGGERPAC